MKKISKQEAYHLYLEWGYDSIMPFTSKMEANFIAELEIAGYKVIDEDSEATK